MRAVKRAHTAPEIVVRQALHASGLRFRLHRRDIPGSPDIVFPTFRMVVFVHEGFWHCHSDCRYATTSEIRQEYWLPKFDANVERDSRKEAQLRELGWRVLMMWECETKSLEALEARLRLEFDEPPHSP